MNRQITDEKIDSYREYLCQEEKAAATVKKYVREVGIFAKWLSGREVTKELTARWKEELQMSGYGLAGLPGEIFKNSAADVPG